MKKLHGGELAVRVLKGEGVRYLFSLSGGHINPIYDACLDANIKVIDVRHEQAAALMAEGWALSTGRQVSAALPPVRVLPMRLAVWPTPTSPVFLWSLSVAHPL